MSQETMHLRRRMHERGHHSAKFMKDGFDRWAETEAPARVGQVQKIPAEPIKQMEGDALSRLYARHARRHGDSLEGGYIPSWVPAIGGYPTSLPEFKEWAPKNTDKVKKVLDVIKNNSLVKKYIPQTAIDAIELYGMSQGYLGDGRKRGTRKGMPRKTARLAYMPAEELEGGYARGTPEYDQALELAMGYFPSGEASARALKAKSMDEVLKGGKRRGKKHMEELEGGGRNLYPTDTQGGAKKRKPSARAQIVKRVMAEKGLSLPQASKYVKEHGLY